MVAGEAKKGTEARRHGGTEARRHEGTKARTSVGTKVSLWRKVRSTIAELPKVLGGRMAKVRLLVILLIVATTFALGDSWRAVGVANAAKASVSSATCSEQACCDKDELQSAFNSKTVETTLACCVHLGTCDCRCCRPLVGIVQLFLDQRRVKCSTHCQAQSCDQFDSRRFPVQLQSWLRAPQRPPGGHTASLLGLSCSLIV